MSYILEALRKADAERERGSVPDLHAQLLPLSVADAEVASPRSALGLWLGLGAALAGAAGGAWFFFGRDPPSAAVPPVAAVAPAVAAVPPVVPPAAAPRAEPAAVPAPLAPVRAPAPVPAAAPPEPPSAKPVARPKASVAAEAPAKAAPLPKPQPPKAPAPEPLAEPLAPPARLPPLAELPVELRQQVPQLVMGGSVYSPQASARMVIINGQVFQEGNNLAPELRLEQIRPKTAVLSIRGQRFEVPL